ncbi:iron hydrogenase small subunit, partial [Gemmatimonadota bacterium]
GKVFDQLRIEPVRGFEGIRYAELDIPDTVEVPDLLKDILPDFDWLAGKTLKVAVAHGTANAKRVLENIRDGGEFADCHFIEFMACVGGCLGGGGQPIPTSRAILEARARGIYQEDERAEVRKSLDNPAVMQLYRDFLTEGPLGQRSHELLHTTYTARTRMMV